MTPQEREAYDAMLACLCGLKMMASMEALIDKQSKWADVLPDIAKAIEDA